MSDDIHLFRAGQTYVPVGAGSTGISLVNQHRYRALRIAISDTPPGPTHQKFHTVIGGESVSHYEIPETFTVYVRADTPTGEVFGHYRAFP